MEGNQKLFKMVFLAFMVALGVVISPILRVEGMCPMAHFINVTCAVLMGPYWAVARAAQCFFLDEPDVRQCFCTTQDAEPLWSK